MSVFSNNCEFTVNTKMYSLKTKKYVTQEQLSGNSILSTQLWCTSIWKFVTIYIQGFKCWCALVGKADFVFSFLEVLKQAPVIS